MSTEQPHPAQGNILVVEDEEPVGRLLKACPDGELGRFALRTEGTVVG